MTQLKRPNIYKLLEDDIKIRDILIDIGCAGFYDLIDFENSGFGKMIGISKDFERNTPFGDYRLRKTENLNLTGEKLRNYSRELALSYNKFDIKIMNFFDYNFSLEVNSLIICNKVLHFYDNKTKFEQIERFYISLQKNGLLFLKINHYLHSGDTDLTKMEKFGEDSYRSIDFPDYEKYLIKPVEFTKELMKNYHVLKQFLNVDFKTLTLVIQK